MDSVDLFPVAYQVQSVSWNLTSIAAIPAQKVVENGDRRQIIIIPVFSMFVMVVNEFVLAALVPLSKIIFLLQLKVRDLLF